MPYYADYLDKAGPDGYHYILEALETKLLLEIDQMLVGAAADQASIQQAAEILRRSNVVLEQAAKEQDAA